MDNTNKPGQTNGFAGALPDDAITPEGRAAVDPRIEPSKDILAFIRSPDADKEPSGQAPGGPTGFPRNEDGSTMNLSELRSKWSKPLPDVFGGAERIELQRRLDNGESSSAIIASELSVALAAHAARRQRVEQGSVSLGMDLLAENPTPAKFGVLSMTSAPMPQIFGGADSVMLQQRLDNGESVSAIVDSELAKALTQHSTRRQEVERVANSLGMKVVDYQPGMDVSSLDKATFVYATSGIVRGPDSDNLGIPTSDGPST